MKESSPTRKEIVLIELLWEYLDKVPGHPDRRKTGWGTKSKVGLIASIEAILTEK